MGMEASEEARTFTLELLRSAVMLTGLADDLIDAAPAEAYPDEEPGAVFVEALSGTIISAVAGVDPRELRLATEIIVSARARVLEHLRLALELSRRMHGDEGSGRVYG